MASLQAIVLNSLVDCSIAGPLICESFLFQTQYCMYLEFVILTVTVLTCRMTQSSGELSNFILMSSNLRSIYLSEQLCCNFSLSGRQVGRYRKCMLFEKWPHKGVQHFIRTDYEIEKIKKRSRNIMRLNQKKQIIYGVFQVYISCLRSVLQTSCSHRPKKKFEKLCSASHIKKIFLSQVEIHQFLIEMEQMR